MFGQDAKSFDKCDLIINQILEKTTIFIMDQKTTKSEFRFYLLSKSDSIDWKEIHFSKWQIIDKSKK
tara:strand:+ start:239 stop:439 length:201 start_codon:yes stop_codon:yes gene_type:complete